MTFGRGKRIIVTVICVSADKPSSSGGGSGGPPAGSSGGPLGLGALFAGGAPKLRPVGTNRERSPSPSEFIFSCV